MRTSGDRKREREMADHVWNPIRDGIDVPALWTCHGTLVYVDLRRRRQREGGAGALTDLKKHVVQLSQKIVIQHFWSLRGKRRISYLYI
jgi:hypothetical protein